MLSNLSDDQEGEKQGLNIGCLVLDSLLWKVCNAIVLKKIQEDSQMHVLLFWPRLVWTDNHLLKIIQMIGAAEEKCKQKHS